MIKAQCRRSKDRNEKKDRQIKGDGCMNLRVSRETTEDAYANKDSAARNGSHERVPVAMAPGRLGNRDSVLATTRPLAAFAVFRKKIKRSSGDLGVA